MFVVLLKFADKSRAGPLMEGHKAWIQRGFDDDVFVLAGSLLPDLGGSIVAHNVARDALERRLAQDPFVAEGVVTSEILELAPSRVDDRLQFLVA